MCQRSSLFFQKQLLTLALGTARSCAIAFSLLLAQLVVSPETRADDLLAARAPSTELRLCSQNLQRFGEQTENDAIQALVERISRARCDVVALQEIFGRNTRTAQRNLDLLEDRLSARAGARFVGYLGDADYDTIRNGFLVRSTFAQNAQFRSYRKRTLPRINGRGPAGTWTRSPVSLKLKLAGSSGTREFFIVNYHLKSKSFGHKDPTQTNFEVQRMSQAADVLALVDEELRAAREDPVVILTGDRNSDEYSATAAILENRRTFADFQNARCRLEAALEPICGERERARGFVPLLAERAVRERRQIATYRYRSKGEILDEILVEARELPQIRATRSEAGTVGDYRIGSDHLLSWADFDW